MGKLKTETTWRELIEEALSVNYTEWADVIGWQTQWAYSDDKWHDEVFVNAKGFQNPPAKPFILWTKKHVYFSVYAEGLNIVGSVPVSLYRTQSQLPVNFGYRITDTGRKEKRL